MKTAFFLFLCLMSYLKADYTVDQKWMPLLKRTMMDKGNYYDITVNDFHFQGSRIWKERWDIISKNIDFEGLRVLDIGTFLGFIPTFSLKYGGAIKATGIDKDNLEPAKNIAKAFEVDSKFIYMHLDSEPYEEMIGTDYDIVFCMSVYYWVEQKQRLLNFLSQFPQIVYEGHDEDEIELERLRPLGYHIKKLGVSYSGLHKYYARGRTIFYLTRL